MHNKGFTLIELMVAMVIFAMLALLGWQSFDGLNKAHTRAKYHADNLSELQYAYLQIHNDINQIVAWSVDMPSEEQMLKANNPPDTAPVVPNFLQLTANSMSFIRFADPDPRYQSTPTFIKVEYSLKNSHLIRRQHDSINDNSKVEQGMESVLLHDVKDLRLQALLPQASNKFSSRDNANSGGNTSDQQGNQPQQELLPKGIAMQFNYKEQAINWRFALNQTAPIIKSKVDNNY